MFTTLADRIRGLASLFWREVAKFGAVGGVAFVIDNGLTYYLMHGPMTDSEAKARFVGASVATVFSWIANRLWTFRHRRQANVLREFLMFVLIYRFLPARRIPWRIAVVSATFTSVVFELLKSAFAWYVAYIAEYRSTYGVFASIVVLIFWIYYSSVVFVLGGEVGQVYELYRIRRRQKELLD